MSWICGSVTPLVFGQEETVIFVIVDLVPPVATIEFRPQLLQYLPSVTGGDWTEISPSAHTGNTVAIMSTATQRSAEIFLQIDFFILSISFLTIV